MHARRIAVLLVDVVLVAGAAVILAWHFAGTGADPPGAGSSTAQAADAAATRAGRRAQAREVRRALAGLERDPAALVATGSRATVGGRARRAVPRGSRVTPSRRSWSPDGAGGGTMNVRVKAPGRPAVTYAAVMIREPGGWKVLATIPLEP